MNANSAQVVMRSFRGGRRAYTCAFRGSALALRGGASLCALGLLCSVLAACTKQEPKDDSTAAGAAGSNTATVAPPAGSSAQANANPGAPASVNANDPRAAVDAGDAFPHCDSSFNDEDGGVSPYLDSCAIDERFGVFVNPNIGPDADADGSRAHPFGTLLHAVAAAVTAHKQVFACEGTYEEPLRIGTALADGLHVFGGLSCDTFALASTDARSHVHSTGDGAALTISDTHDVVIERFAFEDGPGTEIKPGASYVGAFISNARGVVLRDVSVLAHDGEAGEDGAAPKSEAAGDGVAGGDGAAACSASPNPGGSAVTSPGCRSAQGTASGSGGGGGEGTGPGGDGIWYGVPQILGESPGGQWSCIQGQGLPYPGNGGGFANPGLGGKGFGALLGTGFLGFGGQDGGDGSPGGGGGGGGGAMAPSSCAGGGTATGASGGGGGSGGCGGKGGQGGGAGGTSIGLLVISSRVSVEHGAIAYGNGGDGGNGAHGQKGGKGGPAGRGGKGAGGAHAGCDGSAGADGADGGDGGGGNGGHAIGLLFAGDPPTLIDVSGEADEGKHHGGKAGTGPDPTMMPSVGTPGESHFVFEF